MNRIIALATLLLGLGIGVPTEAGHNPRGVRASAIVPTVEVPTRGVLTEHARCAWVLLGPDYNGLLGWVLELDPGEGDGTHAFALDNVSGSLVDWDVVFYSDFDSCLTRKSSSVTGAFTSPGAEAGIIPVGSVKGIVVFRGLPGNQSFLFTIQ